MSTNFFPTVTHSLLTLAIVPALVACGGGGRSGGSESTVASGSQPLPPGTKNTQPTPSREVQSDLNRLSTALPQAGSVTQPTLSGTNTQPTPSREVQPDLNRLSTALPQAGSVTQSTKSTDSITIVPLHNGAIFNIENKDNWIIKGMDSFNTKPYQYSLNEIDINYEYAEKYDWGWDSANGIPDHHFTAEYPDYRLAELEHLLKPVTQTRNGRTDTYQVGKDEEEVPVEHRILLSRYPMTPDNIVLSVDFKRGFTGTDYLALGYWTETDESRSTSTTKPRIINTGVFVDGSDPFTSQVSSLTGRATYSGPIKMTWQNTSSNVITTPCIVSSCTEQEAQRKADSLMRHNQGVFLTTNKHGESAAQLYGNINLTADFGDSETLGHIEGTVDNLKTHLVTGIASAVTSYPPQPNNQNFGGIHPADRELIPQDPDDYSLVIEQGELSGSLDLERAAIGDSDSGFFTGNVSGRVNERNFNGKWGGQFYGNGSADGLPETVAGTMAVSSGSVHLRAPWAADKE